MEDNLFTASGIVRECAVIPRTNDEGLRRDYCLLTIAGSGKLQRFVSSAAYFAKLAENHGIIVPIADKGSVPVTDLVGKAVEIQYEKAIEGRTQYTDDNGNIKTHKSNGNNLRRLFVLSEYEGGAHRASHLEASGVSEFAISTAAKQHAEAITEALAAIRNLPTGVRHETPTPTPKPEPEVDDYTPQEPEQEQEPKQKSKAKAK